MRRARRAGVRRPLLVLVAGVVLVVVGVLQLAVGAALLLGRDDVAFQLDAGLSSSTLTSLGLALVVLGAVSVLLAGGVLRGSRLARVAAGVVEVAQVVTGTYTLVALESSHRSSGLWGVVGGVAVLYGLFGTERARAFFAGWAAPGVAVSGGRRPSRPRTGR